MKITKEKISVLYSQTCLTMLSDNKLCCLFEKKKEKAPGFEEIQAESEWFLIKNDEK